MSQQQFPDTFALLFSPKLDEYTVLPQIKPLTLVNSLRSSSPVAVTHSKIADGVYNIAQVIFTSKSGSFIEQAIH